MTTFAVAAAPLPLSRARAVRTRDAATVAVTAGQLRGPNWQQVSHGLHAPPRDVRTLPELAAMVAQVLPRDSGFGHLTSAALRGWWLPNLLPPHVLLASTRSGVHVQRRGVYVRRSRYADFDDVEGVPCSTVPQTLLELARDLTLIDLVPMVDCALAGGADRDAVLAAARPRAQGAATLRRAVALSDPRSESWWETMLRLQHILTGLGPVESQVEITTDTGLVVARADLHLVGTTRFPECDGGEHRTAARHGKDLRRDKALTRLRLERFGYTTAEIARRPEMVIRDAEDARGLAHDELRIRRWWRFAHASTLTGHGRTVLAARLRRYRLAAARRG